MGIIETITIENSTLAKIAHVEIAIRVKYTLIAIIKKRSFKRFSIGRVHPYSDYKISDGNPPFIAVNRS